MHPRPSDQDKDREARTEENERDPGLSYEVPVHHLPPRCCIRYRLPDRFPWLRSGIHTGHPRRRPAAAGFRVVSRKLGNATATVTRVASSRGTGFVRTVTLKRCQWVRRTLMRCTASPQSWTWRATACGSRWSGISVRIRDRCFLIVTTPVPRTSRAVCYTVRSCRSTGPGAGPASP